MNAIRISIVIPTHNRPGQLPETLAALYEQDLPREEYEIVVVDDGSKPPVQLPPGPEGVHQRLVRLEGVERSAARNAGAAVAVGAVLVFIDDDIVVNRQFLRAHWQAHQEWPEALVTGSIRLPPEERHRPFVQFRQRLEDHAVPPVRGITTAANFCAAGNLSIARDVFEQLGGFDVRLASGEDQDLALRHTGQGGCTAFLPEAVGLHRDRALDVRSYCRRTQWGAAWMVPFCRRYRDWPDNQERQRINGPWIRGDFRGNARKLLKSVLALPPLTAALFAVCGLMEKVAPRSRTLNQLYRLLLGVHLLRGYRQGLKQFPDQPPAAAAPSTPVLTETSAG